MVQYSGILPALLSLPQPPFSPPNHSPGDAHYYQKRACDYAPGKTTCDKSVVPLAFPYGFRMVAGNPMRRYSLRLILSPYVFSYCLVEHKTIRISHRKPSPSCALMEETAESTEGFPFAIANNSDLKCTSPRVGMARTLTHRTTRAMYDRDRGRGEFPPTLFLILPTPNTGSIPRHWRLQRRSLPTVPPCCPLLALLRVLLRDGSLWK